VRDGPATTTLSDRGCLFPTETLGWSVIKAGGEKLPRLRAHSTTLVGKVLYVFGGGDGALYSNEVWAFDTSECAGRRFNSLSAKP
jgi:hypothetical protein